MRKNLNKADILRILKNFLLVVVGTLVLAFGFAVFIIPFNMVAGGVTGIATVISILLPAKIAELVTIDVMVAVITWLLFFIGLITLGRDFAMKTLVSTIIYPIGISLFMKLTSENVLNGFFCLASEPVSDLNLLIGALFGGLCIGAGCALTFLGGGSTGGTDIIAFVICKMFKSLKSSVVIFVIDTAVILSGMLVNSLPITLLGVISAFISATVIDRIFIGQSQAFTADIVSDKYEEINEFIINNMERTSTIIDVTGGYSREGKRLLRVTFSIRQYADLLSIINKLDKHAFVSITRAHEINGEGWTYDSPTEQQ